MGFLSKLGKGLAIGGAGLGTALSFGAASPALAGVLGSIGLGGGLAGGAGALASGLGTAGGLLSGVGSVASGAAKGAQDTRQAQIENLLKQQQLRQSGNTAANQDALGRAQFQQGQQNDQLQRPGLFGKQALMGGLMGNLQDVNIDRPKGSTIPTFNITGGLRPSAMGQDARDAGSAMSRQALMNMLSGGPAPVGLPAYRETPDADLPIESGMGEKLLGGIGLGGSLLGAIGAGLKPPATTPPYNGSIMQPWMQPQNDVVPLFTQQGLQPDLPTMDNPLAMNAAMQPVSMKRRLA